MNAHEESTGDDREIAELLREVGPRIEPSPEAAHEIETVVRAEWQNTVRARRRRRSVVWATAAAIGALAVTVTIGLHWNDSQRQPIARLQRANGEIFVATHGRQWTRLVAGRDVAVGDHIRSDARAAFAFGDSVSLRLDRGTVLQVAAADRVALNVGAVYVDAPPGQTSELVVETHLGSIRHVGTQYQVRATARGIDVSVREGSVSIENPGGTRVAAAGERVRISTNGAVQRTSVAAFDPHWEWAGAVAPAFEIENQTLAAFLEWVSRETGRELVYASPRARMTAESETLHGSIEGLAPHVALGAVLATTSLRRAEPNVEAIIEIELAESNGVGTD